MKYTRNIKFIGLGLIILTASSLFYFYKNSQASSNQNEGEGTELSIQEEIPKVPEHIIKTVAIESGNTYGILMSEKTDLDAPTVNGIYEASKDIYDLAQIKVGNNIELVYNYQDEKFKELVYKINNDEELVVNYVDGKFQAEKRDIPYEVEIVVKEGEIKSSLYEAAMTQDIDERAVIGLAEAFQWTIDFAMDPRVGDTFKFVYEEKSLDGEFVRPGNILAAKYVNVDTPYYVYYFEDGDNSGYFDENGNSVQKMFLKAPVAFKYISSGFTTGQRYVKAFNVSTGHRAIDYAAPSGTPIRAVGDGTITFAGWNGPYGYMVKMRHNSTYSTNYAHMSKMAVKTGNKVKQGDVIGYVGSTGFSTGPHLHYEMVKHGVKINPLAEVLPPGEALKGESLTRFEDHIKTMREDLDK